MPTPKSANPKETKHDAYAALRFRNFRLYLAGNILAVLGTQMQTVAVGWEIYNRTKSSEFLAYVGVVQFLPFLLLPIVAGHVADRFNRKFVLMAALGAMSLASIGMALTSALHGRIEFFYACLLVNGIARAFQQPAKSSFLPHLVPRQHFASAVTWSMTGFQLASVTGPAVSGLLIAVTHNPMIVYLLDASSTFAFAVFLSRIAYRAPAQARQSISLDSMAQGFRFVWRQKILLTVMALDFFAVLLGGATSLLPVFAAEDLLDVGANGLGMMQAAPGVGALLTSVVLAHRRPLSRAGRAMLLAVAGFGVATIVFGLSNSFALSLVVLFFTGAFDMVSVVVRQTLVQLLTPDEMRGRVSAVSGMFIGASNELGGAESGMVAHWISPRASVVLGGIGTLLVVGSAALLSPGLRRYGGLTKEPPSAEPIALPEVSIVGSAVANVSLEPISTPASSAAGGAA